MSAVRFLVNGKKSVPARPRVEFSAVETYGKKFLAMQETGFGRKLDSCGRLVLPKKLRENFNLVIGETYPFYTHQEHGKTYLCIECPGNQDEIDAAIEVLRKNGIKIEVSE